MYSVDDLKLTAYERKWPEMMYKPIIAPIQAKRTLLASVRAAVQWRPGWLAGYSAVPKTLLPDSAHVV